MKVSASPFGRILGRLLTLEPYKWIAAAEAAGLPGQALFDDTLARIQAANTP